MSQQVFAIFRSVTPLVEPLSLDEAYLDVTENAWGETLGMNVARRLKQLIRESTGLTASAGVAPNKFLAKIASAWRKPDGLTVIAPERVESFLQQLPVDALWGVGPVTAQRLRERGITRLVDVRTADSALLREAVGSLSDWLVKLAAGEDDRPVEPNRPSKSSSSECTYARDLDDLDAHPRGDRVDGARQRRVAATPRTSSRAPSPSRSATTTSRRSPAATRKRRRTTPTRSHGALLSSLRKPTPAQRPVRLLGAGVHNLSQALKEQPRRRSGKAAVREVELDLSALAGNERSALSFDLVRITTRSCADETVSGSELRNSLRPTRLANS